ncbi:MAG: GNAT family N-acetyltransferase [Hungatella sp.]
MIELGKAKRQTVQMLGCENQEVLVRGAMEGRIGRIWVPKLEDSSYCLIHVGDFSYVLGLPPKGESALDLKTQIYESCTHDFMIPENELWAGWIEDQFDGQYRLVSRYELKKDEHHFDQKQLKEYVDYVTKSPDGIRIKRIDGRLYHLALKEEWSRDFCANFEDEKHFMEDGLGFVALKGREIVAGCSAYGISLGRMEIEVGTRTDYRKKGLATACSAAFMLECLKNNIFPHWDAANLQSVGLAEKLGYLYEREYTVYQLMDLEEE